MEESASVELIELSGPSGNYGPYADAAEQVRTGYTGNADLAMLNDENSSQILDMVLFGPLSAGDNKLFSSGYLASTLTRHSAGDLVGYTNSESADYRVCANTDGSGLLNWGVSREIAVDQVTYREVDLTYNHCLVEGKFLDGVVTFATGSDILNGRLPAHFFRYNNLTVTQADDSVWTFNGVDALPLGASCVELGAMHSYVSAQRNDTNETWLFDNVVTTVYQDDAGTRCTALVNDADEPSVYSGQIAHSSYGLVSVTQDESAEPVGYSVSIAGEAGASLNFQKSSLTVPADIDVSNVTVHEQSVPWGTVTANTVGTDGEEQTVVAQALTAVRLGGLFPMTDSDEDGLTEGYELAYELTDTDALDDVDQDGLSALEELAVGSNPTDTQDSGWTVDRQITVLHPQDEFSGQVKNVYVAIENLSNRLSAGDFEFTVSVSDAATFASADATSTPSIDFFGNSTTFSEVSCEYTDTALNTLRCNAPTDEVCVGLSGGAQNGTECETDLLLQREFSVIPGSSDGFEITAELVAHPLEENLSNNVAVAK